MRQSWFALLGSFVLLVAAALVGVFGPAILISGPVVPLLVVAGVLATLGGTVVSLSVGPVSVSWRQLLGGSYLAFAVGWPLRAVQHALADGATTSELAWVAVTGVGALAFAFFGVQVLRDGPHADVTPDVDRAVGW